MDDAEWWTYRRLTILEKYLFSLLANATLSSFFITSKASNGQKHYDFNNIQRYIHRSAVSANYKCGAHSIFCINGFCKRSSNLHATHFHRCFSSKKWEKKYHGEGVLLDLKLRSARHKKQKIQRKRKEMKVRKYFCLINWNGLDRIESYSFTKKHWGGNIHATQI